MGCSFGCGCLLLVALIFFVVISLLSSTFRLIFLDPRMTLLIVLLIVVYYFYQQQQKKNTRGSSYSDSQQAKGQRDDYEIYDASGEIIETDEDEIILDGKKIHPQTKGEDDKWEKGQKASINDKDHHRASSSNQQGYGDEIILEDNSDQANQEQRGDNFIPRQRSQDDDKA